MILGNLRAVGPLTLDFSHPTGLRWVGQSTNKGVQPCSITGSALTAQVHQLRIMIHNPGAQVTVVGFTGIVEQLVMDGDALSPLQGLYVLERCTLEVDRRILFGNRLAFQLDGAFLGDLDSDDLGLDTLLTEGLDDLVTET